MKGITESVKKTVAARQSFKCANNQSDAWASSPTNYDCTLWQCRDGTFDEAGYEIDHIAEVSISGDNSVENLQALCPMCHRVKTKRFLQQKKLEKAVAKTADKTTGGAKATDKVGAKAKTAKKAGTKTKTAEKVGTKATEKVGAKTKTAKKVGTKTKTAKKEAAATKTTVPFMDMCTTYNLLAVTKLLNSSINMAAITYKDGKFIIPDGKDRNGYPLTGDILSPIPQFISHDARVLNTYQLNPAKLRHLIQDYIAVPRLTWEEDVGYVHCSIHIGKGNHVSYDGVDYVKLVDYINAHSTTHLIQV
jgi:hypothetical protein